MAIGAGQLVLVDGVDLSPDVTQFGAEFSRVIVDRSALAHRYRRRKVQGQRDRQWSLSAFWERARGATVFRGDRAEYDLMSRVLGDAVGAEALNFRDVVSPKAPTETPLGDLIKLSTEGNVNAPGDGLGYLLYRGTVALTVGNNDIARGAAALDIGALATDRTVRVLCHLHADAPSDTDLQLWHSTTRGGTYALVNAGASIDDLQAATAPAALVGAQWTGVLRRYLGLRVTATTAGTFNATVLVEVS